MSECEFLSDYLLTYLLTYSLTHSLTHSLTPWCRILFERLTVTQLVKKYPAFFMELHKSWILYKKSNDWSLCAMSIECIIIYQTSHMYWIAEDLIKNALFMANFPSLKQNLKHKFDQPSHSTMCQWNITAQNGISHDEDKMAASLMRNKVNYTNY
jgi:hypothetical protein